jgi:RNA polymerase sigma-70 factor, ECF subfamily
MRALLVEKDLGQPAQSGAERLNPSDFGLLYEQHRLSVYRYLRARTSNDADALDLAATTFERAFASLSGFRRRDGGVRAWLLRIARNTAIDAHRRRRATVDLGEADAHLGRAALEADRRDQARVEVLDLVSRLPDDQREALLLRYAGGLSAREIGFVIGKREGAVQKQIERGLAALREAFDDHA